ncbi:MAG: hypothetical protein ACAH27_06005 [Xanthobacteraceae bacterium]
MRDWFAGKEGTARIRRIREYRAKHGCGLDEARDAILAEDRVVRLAEIRELLGAARDSGSWFTLIEAVERLTEEVSDDKR